MLSGGWNTFSVRYCNEFARQQLSEYGCNTFRARHSNSLAAGALTQTLCVDPKGIPTSPSIRVLTTITFSGANQ